MTAIELAEVVTAHLWDRPCREADPYFDPCPAWCVGEEVTPDIPHSAQSCDEDRTHYGHGYELPLRCLTAVYTPAAKGESGSGTYSYPVAEIFLQRNTLHRDPRVHIGLFGASREPLDLTVDEAAQLGELLTRLAEQAR